MPAASRGLFALLILAVSLPSCAGRAGGSAADLHPTLTLTAAIEEGDMLALVAGWRPMRARHEEAAVPLEIAVVNKGLPGLSFDRESLQLEDASGRRYPVLSPEEVRAAGMTPDVDRRLGEILPVVRGRFPTFETAPSNLVPSFDAPSPRTTTFVPRYALAYDLVYFPRPAGGVRGQTFTLLLKGKEVPDPVICRFRVR